MRLKIAVFSYNEHTRFLKKQNVMGASSTFVTHIVKIGFAMQ